jgi:hypothetical protein
MEPDQILHALAEADGLPNEALEAATPSGQRSFRCFLRQSRHFSLRPSDSGRSQPCYSNIFHLLGNDPCGSGKKFKKCSMS